MVFWDIVKVGNGSYFNFFVGSDVVVNVLKECIDKMEKCVFE